MKKLTIILPILLLVLSACTKKMGEMSITQDNQSIIEINFTSWNDSQKKELQAGTLSFDSKYIEGELKIKIISSNNDKQYYSGTITESTNFEVVIDDLCSITMNGRNFSGDLKIEMK